MNRILRALELVLILALGAMSAGAIWLWWGTSDLLAKAEAESKAYQYTALDLSGILASEVVGAPLSKVKERYLPLCRVARCKEYDAPPCVWALNNVAFIADSSGKVVEVMPVIYANELQKMGCMSANHSLQARPP